MAMTLVGGACCGVGAHEEVERLAPGRVLDHDEADEVVRVDPVPQDWA